MVFARASCRICMIEQVELPLSLAAGVIQHGECWLMLDIPEPVRV